MHDVAGPLLAWFARCRRQLPWRSEPRDPYAVLVSELMLQQTQVDRVVPRFEAFMVRFPTLRALAVASEGEVLAAWSGLGYYRRARLLHQLARQVVPGGGGLPTRADELQALPGIGPYTAAAVASLAFGEPVPVLDGNVMRVASRHCGHAGDPRSAAGQRVLRGWVAKLLTGNDPALVNEALMELGALCCLPRQPRCEQCPLQPGCFCGSPEAAARIPPPRTARVTEKLRWVAACVVAADGRWLLTRVSEGPILRGMWLPPLAELADGESPTQRARSLLPRGVIPERPSAGPPVKHSITHRRITVLPIRFLAAQGQELTEPWRWVLPSSGEVASSSLLAKLATAVISIDED